MTYEQFRAYSVPSPMGDHSRSPGDVERLRADMGTLADYSGDRFALNDWLGKGYNPAHDMSHLAGAVQAGQALQVYRSTGKSSEGVIWPGAYVTLSRAYANDHGERTVGADGSKWHVLTATVHPDELVPMNPNEFFYVPRDLRVWYDQQVAKAIRSGQSVPAHVRAAYSAQHEKP
jgi:hypothetical protein